MENVKKWFRALLIVFIFLGGSQHIVFAASLNNSVNDCIQNPKKCTDTNAVSTQNSSASQTGNNQVGLTIWDFVKMIFATIFVVALLYLLLRFINKKSRSYKSTQLVENLGGTALGANRSVQIVKIGNQVFVVGVGENVQLLTEIDDAEERRQLIEEYNNKMEQLIQPSDIVTKVLEKTKNWQSPRTEGTAFSSLLKSQLKDLQKSRKKLFKEFEKKESDKS